MTWTLVAAAGLMAFLAVSCGGSKSAEPDKVVGVLLKCARPAYEDSSYNSSTESLAPRIIPAREYSSVDCQELLDGVGWTDYAVSKLNARYAVTVRTSTGGSYTLEVPATTPVTVGQVWPPTP